MLDVPDTAPTFLGADPDISQSVAFFASATPERTAVQDGAVTLTYAELEARANRLARRLARLGAGPGRIVAIHLRRSADQVIAALAAVKTASCFLPMEPSWPAARLDQVLGDCGVAAMIGTGAPPAAAASGGFHYLDIAADAEQIAAEDASGFAVTPRPDDLAYIIYTSGSTGGPKGVEIPWRNFQQMVAWKRLSIEHTASDRVSYIAGVAFDASLTEIWPTLTSGGGLIVGDDTVRASPEKLRAWLLRERITKAAFVPPALAERLIVAEWPADSVLRIMVTAGDSLHVHPVPGLPFRLFNGYGPTECTVETTLGTVPPSLACAARPTIGRPIPHSAVYLLDPEGRPTPDGAIGEIYIGGENVGRGYRNRPDLTVERFLPDPFSPRPGARMYRTGDLGARLSDGQIAFHGRADDQIQIRGHRVEPAEIEVVLGAHPMVASSVVVARPGPAGHQLVAYLVAAGDQAPTAPMLREFLLRQLPYYMLPNAYVLLDAVPMTVNGKVDKAALPEPDADNTLQSAAYRAPSTPLEADLAELWEEVLGKSPIGVDDNFFDLGGHSLLVARLVQAVEGRFGRKIGMATVFDAPDIARMAAYLCEERAVSRTVNIQPHGSRPRLFWLDAGPYFRSLSDALGPDQPFLGIQLEDEDVRELGDDFNVYDVANRMLEAIKITQPRGPYFLGGFCDWGIVAHCAARQLIAAGEEVSLLCMVHPQYPPEFRNLSPWDVELSRIRQHVSKIAALGGRRALAYAFRHSGAALKRYVTDFAIAVSPRSFRSKLTEACDRYDPSRYPGAVLLIQPRERPDVMETAGEWAALVDGPFEEHEVPGEHLTMLLPPYVGRVGEVLARCIAEQSKAQAPAPERCVA